MSSSYSDRDQQFEEYLRDGIIAAKDGQGQLAQRFLNRALYLKTTDARPYLWLAATTDDLKEQREYLEKAVSLDPSNAAARRKLAQLTGQLAPTDNNSGQYAGASVGIQNGPRNGVQSGAQAVASPSQISAPAANRAVDCPRCGGRMSFAVQTSTLTCEYCGYEQAMAPAGPAGLSGFSPEAAEQVLDFVLPTAQGRSWAEKFQQVSCEKCGASSLLPPGERSTQCPYCGSNQLIEPPEKGDLMEPGMIVLMKNDRAEVARQVKSWLGRGLFAPDNLLGNSHVQLRPAYYSCWAFDGLLEMRWTCEVNEGSENRPVWVSRNGTEARFFSDVLVPGVKTLPLCDLDRVGPFELDEAEAFEPEYLAGWPTILYDESVGDASLSGREKVIRELRPQVYSVIEPGRQKRNVNVSSGTWSNMTFKHILIPLWIGSYSYQGKEYRLLVNGQTGKVNGDKPSDFVKMTFAGLTVVMFIFLLVFLYLLFTNQLPF